MRAFAAVLLVGSLIGCSAPSPGSATPGSDLRAGAAGSEMRVVASGLANPWEIISGPDGWLWVTEKSAGRVVRINPADGTTRVAATIAEVVSTPRTQDGLLGMALRLPDVFLAYSYGTPEKFKITRYVYDQTTATLSHAADLLTDLPASPDHDSGRLVLGPDDKLYYTIGDQGNNQFARYCLPNRAQDLPSSPNDRSAYQGKVLRLDRDGSIPADNPVLAGVRSHVWSYGHRNAQGLAFAGTKLYSSEQGPKTDDEINLIRRGGNYGWPRVSGFRDDRAYAYANWSAAPSCTALTYSDYEVPAAVPRQSESSFVDPAFTEPVRTVGTVADSFDFTDSRCADDYNMCWPTVAPSSLDYYGSGALPGWTGSLLMPALKDGTVHRLRLPDGDFRPELRTVNRYRDVAVSPDGRTIYVATDSAGTALTRDGRPTSKLANPGAVLAFRPTDRS